MNVVWAAVVKHQGKIKKHGTTPYQVRYMPGDGRSYTSKKAVASPPREDNGEQRYTR